MDNNEPKILDPGLRRDDSVVRRSSSPDVAPAQAGVQYYHMSLFIKLYQRSSAYLSNFVQTQLAITIVSLPILVAWGLGYSFLSFVGNLIFTPVLTIFLLLSTLFLFSELFGIPNAWIAQALNKITDYWQWTLERASASWNIASAKPPTLLLMLIPIVMFIILYHPRVNSAARRVGALSALLCMCFALFWMQQRHNIARLPTARFNEKVYVITLANTNSIILVDEGFFSRKKSADKAVDYELKPWITKNFGSVEINEFRILRPTAGSFKAATQLCLSWKVKAVWLPFFKKDLSKYAWWTYFEMRRCLAEKGIRLVRY